MLQIKNSCSVLTCCTNFYKLPLYGRDISRYYEKFAKSKHKKS